MFHFLIPFLFGSNAFATPFLFGSIESTPSLKYKDKSVNPAKSTQNIIIWYVGNDSSSFKNKILLIIKQNILVNWKLIQK